MDSVQDEADWTYIKTALVERFENDADGGDTQAQGLIQNDRSFFINNEATPRVITIGGGRFTIVASGVYACHPQELNLILDQATASGFSFSESNFATWIANAEIDSFTS